MKKSPSQTVSDYSTLSLAVSPELYSIIIGCISPLLLGGRELILLINFQKGGLVGSQFLEGSCCCPFSRVCSSYIKNKLKSEIFNYKKSLCTKTFFSVTNKNLNWEIITKNLVTFKRWDGGVFEGVLIAQCTL